MRNVSENSYSVIELEFQSMGFLERRVFVTFVRKFYIIQRENILLEQSFKTIFKSNRSDIFS